MTESPQADKDAEQAQTQVDLSELLPTDDLLATDEFADFAAAAKQASVVQAENDPVESDAVLSSASENEETHEPIVLSELQDGAVTPENSVQVEDDKVAVPAKQSGIAPVGEPSVENSAIPASALDDEGTQEPIVLSEVQDNAAPAAADVDAPVQHNEPIEDLSELDELVITTKSEAPQFLSLDKTLITIGRETTNDIPLVGTAVSRNHARLEKRSGLWYVTDLGSTNGSFLAKEPLAKNVEYKWQSGHPLQIGAFTLQWQSPRDLTSGQTLVLMPDQVDAMRAELAAEGLSFPVEQEPDAVLSVMMDKSALEIELGNSAEIKLGILSQGKLDKHIEVSVVGIPEHWVNLQQRSYKIAPKKHRSVPITIEMPESTLVVAGEYNFEVLLRDVYTKQHYERLAGTINVPPVRNFSLRMIKAEGQNSAALKLTLKNSGNAPASYKLSSNVPPSLKISGTQWNLALPAGQTADAEFRLVADKRPLFGKAVERTFEFSAEDDSGLQKDVSGSIELTPRIPTIAFALIVIACILLIAAFIAFLS